MSARGVCGFVRLGAEGKEISSIKQSLPPRTGMVGRVTGYWSKTKGEGNVQRGRRTLQVGQGSLLLPSGVVSNGSVVGI